MSEERWMKENSWLKGSYDQLYHQFSHVRNFSFADWNRRRMVLLEEAIWWGRPVAFYNGAWWWGTREKEHHAKHETLYPIFIDIQQPNRGVYYREDRAMWSNLGRLTRYSQAKGLSNYHSDTYDGYVYDFAKREITKFEKMAL